MPRLKDTQKCRSFCKNSINPGKDEQFCRSFAAKIEKSVNWPKSPALLPVFGRFHPKLFKRPALLLVFCTHAVYCESLHLQALGTHTYGSVSALTGPWHSCGIDQSLHLQALGAHAVYCELLQLRVLKLMRLTRFSVLRALDFLQFTATCRRNIV